MRFPLRHSVNSVGVSLHSALSPSLSLAAALSKQDEGMIRRPLQLRPPINTALLRAGGDEAPKITLKITNGK